MRREFMGIKNDMLEYSVKDMITHKIWIETRVNIELKKKENMYQNCETLYVTFLT